LELLNRFKELKDGAGRQADDVRKELDKAREELKVCIHFTSSLFLSVSLSLSLSVLY
jgi:hypothetical protein